MKLYFLILITIGCYMFQAKSSREIDARILISPINKVLNFVDVHYKEINFDGLLGIVLAKAQLEETWEATENATIREDVQKLTEKCDNIQNKIEPLFADAPFKLKLFGFYLFNPRKRIRYGHFRNNQLINLGTYNWTADVILSKTDATFEGRSTDGCFIEVLEQDLHSDNDYECYVGPICRKMMLADRIDTGYLLTHRLLYLQIVRVKKCRTNPKFIESYTKRFCSLILKEARTNELLGFPYHDIFLEQVTLCGMEGYTEFLEDKYLRSILSWQHPSGCFKRVPAPGTIRRSSNVISYGCSDHTTGLGAAALSLNLKYKVVGIHQ